MGSNGQTFNYQQHNVCGGPSHRHVHQGPKPEMRQALIQPPPPPEGHYVTRERGTMSAVDYRMLVRWRKDLEMRGQWPGEYKYYPCPRPYYPNN